MQIGDKVQVVGTVRDIVGGNVLMVTEDAMDQREYWFIGSHVKVLEEAAAVPPAVPGAHPDQGLPGEGVDEGEGVGEPTHPIVTPPPVGGEKPDQGLPGTGGEGEGEGKPEHPIVKPPASPGVPTHPIAPGPEPKRHR
jgi:hypothetical protein